MKWRKNNHYDSQLTPLPLPASFFGPLGGNVLKLCFCQIFSNLVTSFFCDGKFLCNKSNQNKIFRHQIYRIAKGGWGTFKSYLEVHVLHRSTDPTSFILISFDVFLNIGCIIFSSAVLTIHLFVCSWCYEWQLDFFHSVCISTH